MTDTERICENCRWWYYEKLANGQRFGECSWTAHEKHVLSTAGEDTCPKWEPKDD